MSSLTSVLHASPLRTWWPKNNLVELGSVWVGT